MIREGRGRGEELEPKEIVCVRTQVKFSDRAIFTAGATSAVLSEDTTDPLRILRFHHRETVKKGNI